MDSIKLWARDGEAVRQAIEFGEIAHMETASEELTDAFLLFAIESGLLQTWAQTFPDPRREPTIGYGGDLTGPYSSPICRVVFHAESGLCAALGAGVGRLGL